MRQKVLIVDDYGPILKVTSALLRGECYKVFVAGPERPYDRALEIWEKNPELRIALVDLKMPGLDGVSDESVGFSLIKKLKERPFAWVAAHSAYTNHPNLKKAAEIGADGFIGKEWTASQKLTNVGFLTDCIKTAAAIYRSIDLRDPYTSGHSTRVRDYCRHIVANLASADPANFDLAACLVAAELHDLGKLEMPDDLLLGADSGLTSDQRRVLERHVDAALSLRYLGFGFDKVANIAYQHHRRYAPPRSKYLTDYPKIPGLPRGDRIPLEARVLHVADVLDALLSDRSYRPGLPLPRALSIIQEETQLGNFDPKVVTALEQLYQTNHQALEEIAAQGRIRDEASLCLFFGDKRLTAGRLNTLLLILSDVYLRQGKAIDRLAIMGLEVGDFGGGATTLVRLKGKKADIEDTFHILKARMAEDKAMRKKPLPRLPDTVIRGLRPVPLRVELRAEYF